MKTKKARLTIYVVLSALLLVLASVSSLVDARWYDPETGRFISKDPRLSAQENQGKKAGIQALIQSNPTALQSFNPYVFCGNNPINYVDPSGGCTGSVMGCGGGGISGVVSGKWTDANIEALKTACSGKEECECMKCMKAHVKWGQNDAGTYMKCQDACRRWAHLPVGSWYATHPPHD